jgi:hypothetical protein
MKKKKGKKRKTKYPVFYEGDTVLAKDGFCIHNDEFLEINGQKVTGIVRHKIDMNFLKRFVEPFYIISAFPKRYDIVVDKRYFTGIEMCHTRMVITEKTLCR